jgi:hypothetical protein
MVMPAAILASYGSQRTSGHPELGPRLETLADLVDIPDTSQPVAEMAIGRDDTARRGREPGKWIRMTYTNTTTMWHPMHLHGHAFAVGGPNGPRKRPSSCSPAPA